MASTGSEAVRFRPRFADRLGPLRHVRLTVTCAALSPPRFRRAVPVGCWCMELAVSKLWAGDCSHDRIRAVGGTNEPHPGTVENCSVLDEGLETTSEFAEVGAAGSTCIGTTRVLENCPSLTEILLLLARANKEIPDDDRLAVGGFADSRMEAGLGVSTSVLFWPQQ